MGLAPSDHTGRSPIHVAIIDSDRRIRDGLAMLIDGSPGYRCSLSFRSLQEAVEGTWTEIPELALVDIGLPGLCGDGGLGLLRRRYPSVILLLLAVYEDDERIFQAICAGASGYLSKKTPPARLLEALQEALAGGAPMSPEIARRVLALFREFHPPAGAGYALTPSELRLLQLVVEGHSYQDADGQLAVSTSVRTIYGKLQAHWRSEAVLKGRRHRPAGQ